MSRNCVDIKTRDNKGADLILLLSELPPCCAIDALGATLAALLVTTRDPRKVTLEKMTNDVLEGLRAEIQEFERRRINA